MAATQAECPDELRSDSQTERLQSVATVDIDSGVFKYVLIKVSDGDAWKRIVRGYCEAEYHADVFDRVRPGLEGLGLATDVEGGGRIEHRPGEGKATVYGYSMGFGRARHAIAADLIREAYPAYRSVDWSNEGY